MALRYRVLLAAVHEFASAAAYHEERREGFGLKLFDEYDAVIERALKFPNSGARVALKSRFEVRRFQLRRFRTAPPTCAPLKTFPAASMRKPVRCRLTLQLAW